MSNKLSDLLRPFTHWRRYRPAENGEHGGPATIIRAFSKPLPAQFNASHLLGIVAGYLLLIQVVTGVLMAIYYQPSLAHARESLVFVSSEVSFGWLIRSTHRWAAELVLIVLGLHLARVLLVGAYRAPRGLNWVIGVGLLACVLAFRFTGHLLPGDQESYWSAMYEARIVGSVPLIGSTLQSVLYGGAQVGSESLARFLAIHTMVLPWAAFFLVFLHIYLVRRQGLAGAPVTRAPVATAADRDAEADDDAEAGSEADDDAEAGSEADDDAEADSEADDDSKADTSGDGDEESTADAGDTAEEPEPDKEPGS